MKRVLGVIGALTLVLATGLVTTGPVGAQPTSTPVVPLLQVLDLQSIFLPGSDTASVYVVHGLNLDGQTAQSDGGTAVTVCANGDELLADLQFGDIAGPVSLPVGVNSVAVFVGAGIPCDSTEPLVVQEVVVPDVAAASIVATAGPDGSPALLAVPLDITTLDICQVSEGADAEAVIPAGSTSDSRLAAVHAAAAGTVEVVVDGSAIGELDFGESLTESYPPGPYSVEVTLGGNPIVGPLALEIGPCTLVVAYVVGNQPIEPAPVPAPAPAPAPAAAAVTAAPAFTG